jgi:hypothetical protein
MKSGDYAGACSRFSASQGMKPAAGTSLNLAVCHNKLGQLRDALRSLHEFLRRADATDDRRSRATVLLADIEQRMPRLELRARSRIPAGARIVLDGQAISSERLRLPLALDPGEHVLELTAPGHGQERRTFEIKERERRVEAVVFTRTDPVAPPAPSRPIPQADRPLPALFYVSLGVGVAGLLTAAGSGLIVLQQRGVMDDSCNDKTKECTREGLSAEDQARRYSIVNTVAWGVGVAGTAFAGYLLFDNKRRGTAPPIDVAVGSSHAILSARGAF